MKAMEKTRHKILLIDDDPFFLKVLADAFTDGGFSVVTAGDGIEGVKSFVEHRPEVVISDLIMPRMGGVSTCMEIRRLAREPEPLIILLTSMFHGAPRRYDPPEMGAQVHIPKSTPPSSVVIIVEQLLSTASFAVQTD